MRKQKLILAIAGLFLALGLNAQNITVKGTVTDNTGEAVINAGVVVKGTLRGVSTDLDGNYAISCPSDAVLVFSFIGLETQEVPVNGRGIINVTLLPDSEFLTESVVTALGIRRDAKALGYAATTVNTEELLTANTVSPVASLQGKVAGVEINQSDGGLFGSTKIQIRGASTLSNNNQPIYVIDGVILDNAVANTGDADWDGNINDYGNQLKNLNPDDFESLTVLKGAAATALYGSRGLNGAVVITTKHGKANQGIGISFSQTIGFDKVYDTPGLQSQYLCGDPVGIVGYGDEYESTGSTWVDNFKAYARNDAGVYSMYDQYAVSGWSWGANIDNFRGQQVELFDGTMGTIETYPNRYKDAFQMGINSNTHLAITGGNDKTSFYVSGSYKYAEGTTPNNTFDRLSFLVKAGHHITDNLIVDASFNFTSSTPRNAQKNIGEYFASSANLPAEYNTAYYKDKYKGPHGGIADGSYGDQYQNVPAKDLWWSIYENNYQQVETTIRPTLEVTWKVLPWLDFKVGGNYNYYLINGEEKNPGSGYANQGGNYKLNSKTTQQLTAYYGANANYQFSDDFEVHGFLRGEYFDQKTQFNESATSGGLIIPLQYFISNSINTPSQNAYISGTKRITSAVGAVGMSWKDQLFVDLTGRNDWSSALVYADGHGNYSYFYPSISTSWIASETFDLPKWISFMKFRASLAQVGNDTSPYYINSGYSIKKSTFNGLLSSLQLSSQIKSLDLRPERKTSWELGFDWRFFNNRLGLDFTFYKENTRDQIMSISVPSVSGISTELVNAGDIQNQGIEIALNTTPIETRDFRWDVDFTFTRNRNKIVSLHEDVANWIVLDGSVDYGNYRIGSVAKVGAEYGLLMTDSFPNYDERTGYPICGYTSSYHTIFYPRSGEVKELGSMNPKFLSSANTTLRYKNVALRASFDARFGGYVASYNSRYATAYGMSTESLKYREGMTWTSQIPGLEGKTFYDGFIPEAVFRANTKSPLTGHDIGGMTYQEAYEAGEMEPAHKQMYGYLINSWGNGVINEDWVKELNYISLREVTISWSLPTRWANAIKARGLSISATGRNLCYLLNTAPNHENPEAVRGTGSSNFRMRSFSPYTRNYLFTVNISF